MESTPTTYDHKAFIEAAATPLARELIKILAENADDLIVDVTIKRSPDDEKAWNERCTDICIKIVSLISTSNLPYEYSIKPVEKIDTVLTIIKNYINGRVNQTEDELVSRTLGIKSPESKYRKQHATLGQLMVQLDTVRQSQGNDENDYFNVIPTSASTVTPEIAPEIEMAPSDKLSPEDQE